MQVLYLHLLHPSPLGKHRSATKAFQARLSKAIFSRSRHSLPIFLRSISNSRLQVFLGLPLLLLPWGFHRRACLAMLSGGFLSVCPIHRHLLLIISCSTCRCPALSHSSLFVVLSYHLKWNILRRHLLMNVCSFLVFTLVVLHVSAPYRRTDLTFELNIIILVLFLIILELHMFFRMAEVDLAFSILNLTSSSEPP